jgi:hemin uptake protein HemP
VVSPCNVTPINLSGAPFNPVDGYVPQGSAEYKQLLALGYIPVSGECDEACVIEVQALLSSGQLKLGPRARAAAAHLDLLGKAQLKIQHGTATVQLKFTKAGKKLLAKVTAKNFEIEIKLWATTPSGKRLGKTKVAYLHVKHK